MCKPVISDPGDFQQIIIESLKTNDLITIPLEKWGDESFGFSEYRVITFSNGTSIELLVEVELPNKVLVTLRDTYAEITLRTVHGLAINYDSPSVGYITVKLGEDIPSD